MISKKQKEYLNKVVKLDHLHNYYNINGYLIFLAESNNYITSFEYIGGEFNIGYTSHDVGFAYDYDDLHFMKRFLISLEFADKAHTINSNKNEIKTVIDIHPDSRCVQIIDYIDNIRMRIEKNYLELVVDSYSIPSEMSIKKFMELDFPVTDRLKQLIVENL